MAKSQDESGNGYDPDLIEIRRPRFRRVVMLAAVGILAVLVVALVIAWTQRRPIARNIIDRELASRGVDVSYSLDRVGLRTQRSGADYSARHGPGAAK